MLYGKPTKHVRVHREYNTTIEPQRFKLLTFWRYSDTATARTDGQDLKDSSEVPLGSRITKHKVDILVTPETIEPQQLYIGRIKLSFNDVLSRAISGCHWDQASYQDVATESATAISNAITPHMFPEKGATANLTEAQVTTGNQEVGGSGSGMGIQDWLMDDHVKHFINLKKVTVFDQRPLMGERWQRIPSKVKRINEGCYYGLFIFNDSPRGATPADTQVTVNLKSYFEEMAI